MVKGLKVFLLVMCILLVILVNMCGWNKWLFVLGNVLNIIFVFLFWVFIICDVILVIVVLLISGLMFILVFKL